MPTITGFDERFYDGDVIHGNVSHGGQTAHLGGRLPQQPPGKGSDYHQTESIFKHHPDLIQVALCILDEPVQSHEKRSWIINRVNAYKKADQAFCA